MYEVSSKIANQQFEKLHVEILVETPKYDILTISLEKDAVFPEHSSPTDAVLIVLEGEIVFHIDGEPYHLAKQQSFNFPKRTEHWVKATTNSKFLIVR